MPFYSKEELDEFLGLTSQTSNKIQQEYCGQGPGYMDTWLSLMEGDENSWLKIKDNAKITGRQKIILCDPKLTKPYYTHIEADWNFLSSLIYNYDVYLWTPFKSFSECHPLHSAADFLNNRNELQPAIKKEVETALDQQSMALGGIIILDNESMQQLSPKFRKSPEILSHQLDLRDVKIDDDQEIAALSKGINFNNIYKVRLTACILPHVKKVSSLFKNLKEIEFCTTINMNDYPNVLKLLEGIDVSFRDMDHSCDRINIENINLNAVKTKSAHFGELNIDSHVKEIELNNTALGYLQLSSDHNVERISLTNCSLINIPNTGPFAQLKELTIDKTTFTELDPVAFLKHCFASNELEKLVLIGNKKGLERITELSIPDSIKHLELVGLSSLSTIEANHRHLKFLSIKNCPELTNGSIINMITEAESLEELTLSISELVSLTKPLPFLKKLVINCEDASHLDLSLFPNLEMLKIERANLVELDCSSLKNLKELYLEGLRELQSLNIANNDQLHTLDLYDCTLLETIQMASSHPKLTQKIAYCHLLPIVDKPKTSGVCVISQNNIKQIDFATISEKKEITFNGLDGKEQFDIIHRMKLPNTRRLMTRGCNFSDFDFKENAKIFSNLEDLHLLASLPERTELYYDKLQMLEVYSPNVKELDLSSCTDLKKLIIRCSALEKITLPKNVKLEYLEIVNCQNLSMTISNCQELKEIKATKVMQVDISNCSNLSKIEADTFKLVSIDLKGCTRLHTMNILEGAHLDLHHAEDAVNLLSARITTANVVDGINKLNPNCHLYSTQENIITQQTGRVQQLNHESPVAIFNFESEDEIDGNTNDKKPHEAKGGFKVTLSAKQKLSRHDYRINVYNTITYHNGKLRYTSSIDPNQLEPVEIKQRALTEEIAAKLHHEVQQDNQYVLGMLEGTLLAKTLYKLPDTGFCHKDDIEFYTDPPDAFKLSYCSTHQQFYITADTVTPVKILYRLKTNPRYAQAFKSNDTLDVPIVDPLSLLPDDVYSALQEKIANLPDEHLLAQIMYADSPVSDKLRLLANYCRFENAPLNVKPEGDLDLTWQIIIERKGACRHRARSFMLLANMLGVAVDMISNELHQFVAIPFFEDGNPMRMEVDLGGAEVNDITPLAQRDNVFDRFQQNPKEEKDNTSKNSTMADFDPWEEAYYELFKQKIAQDALPSLNALFAANDLSLPPLLECTDQASLYRVNQLIAAYLRTNGKKPDSPLKQYNIEDNSLKKYVYIDSPNDFALYLKPYQIGDGKRKQIDGPLKDIIENGGVIVVNWSNFTATEIASFKSIIDAKPTILGKPVCDNVKVIGLMTSNTALCAATISRCKRYTIDSVNAAEEESTPSPALDQDVSIEEVDLFHQANWREKLLGKVNMQGISYSLIGGAIFKALDQGKKLVIYNPPDDDKAYELLLYRIKVEKRFLYNGKVINVPDDFTIEIKQKSHPNTLSNVFVEESAQDISQNKIYLGMHNLHECMELLHIDNATHTAHTLPGLLENFDINKDVFYVTQSITEHAWQALLDHISKQYPQKAFRFVLANGVSIENVFTNNTPNKREVRKEIRLDQSTYISNDPDYLTSKLMQCDPQAFVIDISRETSFNDLIAELSCKDGFHYYEKSVLAKLKKPEDEASNQMNTEEPVIILNGEMSSTLYQQLLPLLSGEKNFMVNGKNREIKGKLLAVMPERCKEYVQDTRDIPFDFSDYLKQLPESDISDGELIIQFFNLAKAIPHRGDGSPTVPKMTQKRFQNMVEKLKEGKLHLNDPIDKLHRHNPIKGLFHFDYLPGSIEYAYLNASAKYLFDIHPVDQASIDNRLGRLIVKYRIKTGQDIENNLWRILNCYDGQSLKQLLGDNYNPLLVNKNGYPFVSAQILQKLTQEIKRISLLPVQEKVRDTNKKLNRVVEILKDPNISMIFLKGQPGVGKSHAIRHSQKELNIKCYEGDEAIIAWLNAESGRPAVLLLDEANMAKPGVWNFLNGINRDQKKIYYRGEFHDLKPHHKIIATGNPENYPARFYHEIFQQTAETILFKQFSDKELTDKILRPTLESYLNESDLHQSMNDILFAFHLIEKYSPYFSYTTRDLENLSIRFIYLLRNLPDQDKRELLYQAIASEFAGTIYEKEKREEFVVKLKQRFCIKPPKKDEDKNESDVYKITDTHVVSREKAYAVNAIQEDLNMRKMMLEDKPNLSDKFYKTCVIIEGDAGLGKSKMYESILQSLGFSENASGSQKYYTVSAGSEEAYTTLIKAFDEGAIVILDEINLDPGLEKLLNDLLTGLYQGRKANNPGFMVLASQNPGTFEGREPLSPALRNRTHFLYMDKYKKHERVALASYYGVKQPEAFVRAEKHARQGLPKRGRMRTFFSAIENAKKIANDGPEIEKVKKSNRR